MGVGKFTRAVVELVVLVVDVVEVVVVTVELAASEVVTTGDGVTAAALVVLGDAILWTQRPSFVAHVPGAHLQRPPSRSVGPSQALQAVLF